MHTLNKLITTNSKSKFNIHGSVHRNNILVYDSNEMHKSQSLLTFIYLTGGG
jgi:hypothetical protein